jgi:hypothetical protein
MLVKDLATRIRLGTRGCVCVAITHYCPTTVERTNGCGNIDLGETAIVAEVIVVSSVVTATADADGAEEDSDTMATVG